VEERRARERKRDRDEKQGREIDAYTASYASLLEGVRSSFWEKAGFFS